MTQSKGGKQTNMLMATTYMQWALEKLKKEQSVNKSRANSESINLLETALMWNNKDRTNKGELSSYPTHLGSPNLTAKSVADHYRYIKDKDGNVMASCKCMSIHADDGGDFGEIEHA